MAAETLERAEVERQVLEVVREFLLELGKSRSVDKLALDSSLERDLGLGSLDLVELLVRFEAQFDTQLPEEVAEEAETPAGWVRAILRGTEPGGGRAGWKRPRVEREAPPPPEGAATLVDVLRWGADRVPERVHARILEDGSSRDVTYYELLARGSRVAAGLVQAGLKANDRVAIMLPTSADFLYAFAGVMLAGGIAAPVYPPSSADKIEEYVRRQMGVLRNAGIRFLIAFDQVKAVAHLMRGALAGPVELATVEGLERAAGKTRAPGKPAEAAFLQYTSGSTGDPKGVVLSHANVLANIRGIGRAVELTPADSVVSWLPLYSDLGLIGSWLFSLYHLTPLTLLSPLEFLKRPESWLWAIHDARGTLGAAPNFAYELCAREIPAWTLEGLDLSGWRVAVNAGEAVLPETIERFCERFGGFGFRRDSFSPCYGLSECSVALTIPPVGRAPRLDQVSREVFEREGRAVAAESARGAPPALRFFSVGRPLAGHEVRVVDEQGGEAGERVEGRILFRGPSQTQGYFGNPKATAAAMSPGGWMDTGDLGYLAAGELYFTGRGKDVILKAGRSISPIDVERAAIEVPGVVREGAAAFGVVDAGSGTERLVVVAETTARKRGDLVRVKAGVARSLENAIGLAADEIQLIPRGCLPKTSNEKLRRQETRALYVAGGLPSRRRPAWAQLARVFVRNAGAWSLWAARQASARARRMARRALVTAVAAGGGLAVRAFPRLGRTAARCVVRAAGGQWSLSGSAPEQAAVLMANRAQALDPLVLLAALPGDVRLADDAALAALPAALRFLLKPLVAPPAPGAPAAEPGGGARQALEAGRTILLLPDSAPGTPAQLCRYRLDAIHAALATGAPVRAVAVQDGSVRVGAVVEAEDGVRLRERARSEIASLCR